jgi:hypothetical protein
VYSDNWVFQTGEEQPIALYDYDSDVLLNRNLLQEVGAAPAAPLQPLLQYFRAFRQQYNQRLIDNEMTVELGIKD